MAWVWVKTLAHRTWTLVMKWLEFMNVHPPIQMVYGWPSPYPIYVGKCPLPWWKLVQVSCPIRCCPIPISHLASASSQCTLCTIQRYRMKLLWVFPSRYPIPCTSTLSIQTYYINRINPSKNLPLGSPSTRAAVGPPGGFGASKKASTTCREIQQEMWLKQPTVYIYIYIYIVIELTKTNTITNNSNTYIYFRFLFHSL